MTTEAAKNLARWAEAAANAGRALTMAERQQGYDALEAWRREQSADHRGAGTPGEFGRPGY